MTRKGRKALLGAVCAAVAAAGSLSPSGAQAKQITIAVSMKTQVQRRWEFDATAMRNEAAKLGAKLIFQFANDSPTTQASQVENLLSQGPDVLIIVPVDSKAAGAIVESAHSQNVPVIAYDIGVGTAKVDYFICRDNPKVGELQSAAAKRMFPKGVYALIKGDPANDVAQIISKGYDKYLVPDKDLKIVSNQFTTNWDPRAALTDAENVLSAQNDHVDAFLASNDGMAGGAAQAITSRNLGGKVFLSGLDAEPANLQLIAKGVQTMTVWTDLTEEGSSAVKAAFAIAQQKKPDIATVMFDAGAGEVPTHLVTVTEVNKDNLCKFVTQDAPKGWVTVDQVYGAGQTACK
jgi:D-xylose transport system substrate-binding protein